MGKIHFVTLTPKEFAKVRVNAAKCDDVDGIHPMIGAFCEVIDEVGRYWGSFRIAKQGTTTVFIGVCSDGVDYTYPHWQ